MVEKKKAGQITEGSRIVASIKVLACEKKTNKLLNRSGLMTPDQLRTPMQVIHVKDGQACVKHPDKPMSFIAKATFFEHAEAVE